MRITSIEITLLIVLIVIVFYLWLKKKYDYFKEKGIPYLTPTFLLGSTWKFLAGIEQIGELYMDLYSQGKGHKYIGFFQGFFPIILLRDPSLIEQVLIKDFSSFHDRGLQMDIEREPLEGNLFLLPGERWKRLRAKLSPTFTSGKLKWMFEQMKGCSKFLLEVTEKVRGDSTSVEIEIKDLLERYTSTVIGSCAFGYDPDLTDKMPFRYFGGRVFNPTAMEGLQIGLRLIAPSLHKALGFRPMQKDVVDFFTDVMKQTLDQRRLSGIKRKDLVELLLQLKEKGYIERDPIEIAEDEAKEVIESGSTEISDKIDLTDEMLTAQAFLFFEAGLETSATCMGFACYLLAKHQVEQEKAREEIRKVKEKHGDFTYDALKEMIYLDNCIKESLRMHPPVGIHFRECTKPFAFEDGILIEKGTKIIVPVKALHYDPEYWDNPETFSPSRFSRDNKSYQTCSYIPWGDGPRICIGKRFAEVEMKLGMAVLLDNYRIELSPKLKMPLQLKPRGFIAQVLDGLWLKLIKL